MNIVITGNMGYVGPSVVRQLRASYPEARLIGFDAGYFAACTIPLLALPELMLDEQHFGDVRQFPESFLEGVDAIVHLAAISNDPIGNLYEGMTMEINHRASVNLARMAKKAGVKSFVFASSCSIYGAAEDSERTEDSSLNPLTAYARSKVFTERDVRSLAGDGFTVTCLRFATACGISDRLRLDLVLNDFVAGAVASKKISILSDGTPWRPLIDVKDMARAIDWAISRTPSVGGEFLAVNAGHDEGNYQVRELAESVARIIPNVDVQINENAPPDRRSYRVSFNLFKQLAPNYQPVHDLTASIKGLKDGLDSMLFSDAKFRESTYMRLVHLNRLRDMGLLNEKLQWMNR
ncbi:NAD-dependent epimerase [Geobacter sulfurreducens]|nr:NAD-dependent epimerase [Geobacter sulfurreducens]